MPKLSRLPKGASGSAALAHAWFTVLGSLQPAQLPHVDAVSPRPEAELCLLVPPCMCTALDTCAFCIALQPLASRFKLLSVKRRADLARGISRSHVLSHCTTTSQALYLGKLGRI